ncbi:MAG TPA: hypothetical protein VH040_11115 [Usitatibacter sp.]|jgi:hypothetical protein|nr:hypothetical protein [Usitatibacter sp.]
MDNFRIWGRIEQLAADEFEVIVTAVPESTDPAGVQRLTSARATKADAKVALHAMIVRMKEAIAAADGRVTDTEINGL